MAAVDDPSALSSTGAGCPSTAVLADLAEGRLPKAERPPVERHLAACAMCRAIAVGMGYVGAPPAGSLPRDGAPASASPSRRWVWLLLAAAALLAVGWWWWSSRAKGADPADAPARAAPRDFDAEFAEAARKVSQAHPELFGDFAPLPPSQLAATHDPGSGGIDVLAPREVLLSGRPTFRWKRSGQANVYTLALRSADGAEAFNRRIEGTQAEFPADAADLAPGSSWTWSVRARRQSGPVEGSLAFRIASREEAARFAQQAGAIRASAPARTADLLIAHVAIRARLLEEAERLLVAQESARPLHPAEQQALAYVQVVIGTFPKPR